MNWFPNPLAIAFVLFVLVANGDAVEAGNYIDNITVTFLGLPD